MGRAKLNMELISKEKARDATFKKRKESLKKKLNELTTLCNVNGCMIMYGPEQSNGSKSEPEIWTNSSNTTKSLQEKEIQNLIDEYKKSDVVTRSAKAFGLSDYFTDRNKNVEKELIKLRKMNMDKKYPGWLKFMDHLSEIKLRQFISIFEDKVEKVKLRIDLLKGNMNIASEYFVEAAREGMELSQLTNYCDNVSPLMVQGGSEMGGFMNNHHEQAIYSYCNSIVHHHEQAIYPYWQYNGATSSSGSNNTRDALMKYETMMTYNMICNNQMPYSPYVAPTIRQPAPYMMMPGTFPQIDLPSRENEGDVKGKLLPYLRK